MENHSLTINISQNISNQCFHGRTSARTDVLKLSLIMIRQSGIVGNWETPAIGNGEILGNAGNRGELAIGKRRQLGITGNWQSRESSGNPAIQGMHRECGNVGNARM